MARYDVVVIGGGPQRPRRRRLPREGRPQGHAARGRERVGGILRRPSLAEGVSAPGIAHTVGRLRRVGRQGPPARAARLRDDRPRPCACSRRSPTARRRRSGAMPRARRAELRERTAHDADAFDGFDARCARSRRFLAYVNVDTPPDVKAPSLADAMMGLKLGQRVPRARRQDRPRGDRARCRWRWPTSWRRSFESEAVRGAARDPRRAVHGDGPVGDRHGRGVPSNDSAGQRRGRGRALAVFARGGTGALASALEAAARSFGRRRAHRRRGRRRSVDGRPRARRHARRRRPRFDAQLVVVGRRPQAHAPPVRSRRADPHEVARENIRQPGAIVEGEPRALGLPAFDGADDAERLRAASSSAVDRPRRAGDGREQVRPRRRGPVLEATIPTLVDPSLAPEGTHVMSILFQCAPRSSRDGRLGVRARPGRRHRREVDGTVRARPRRARRGARGDHARGHGDRLRAHAAGTSTTPSRRSISSSRGGR